ncbi:HAD-IIIA family hydrolase [Paenibacillus sp. TRM 82003]|uniref:HAD-IIIA family hydrolase n=1 Tax=Kineococcus sp. TRM81007 TaxID=2925831 RepID=UPI001F564A7A|nr:HAD-IIIA family hydrolase [Kineococcus sp. TRM81007]MCI2240673.1 HAD-IIIA family hydrolase [Kineococcus sp. TRM81007]MCI3925405.1 HAD-IIIA family hydrolase [Paenibacillus sp. TRM 82003]
MTPAEPAFSVVVPTVGRPSLDVLLGTLAAQRGPRPELVVVVDDRRGRDRADDPCEAACARARGRGLPVRLVRSGGRGPAAARNAGWRRTATEWVAFVDDDVELPGDWSQLLVADLAAAPERVAGVQGRITVPLPADRRPTDWERGTAGLADAAWITADMAYRRSALEEVAGFDERFPRAFREDADLALRVLAAGWELVRGAHGAVHPVRPSDDLASLRQQRGNADDATMTALHGRDWRERAQSAVGRLPGHVATTAAAATALGALLGRRPRLAAGAALAWAGLTAEFAWRRIAPGPRDAAEVRRMLVTSAAIPPAAVWHRVRGELRWRRNPPAPWPPPVRAVLFDRDGTLVHDVPYNGDPDLVEPVDGAAEALARVRAAGLRTGLVTNQSGVARGLLTREQVDAVNARVARLLGPFGTVQVCTDGPDEPSSHRKPEPGMVLDAARRLGVLPAECLLIGDIGADVEAALSAGARAVLVPTLVTRPEEVTAAPLVATTLTEAVEVALTAAGGTGSTS